MKYYVMFDVGGTQIKAGILNEKGELYKNEIYSYPSRATEPKEIIFSNFKEIIIELEKTIEDEAYVISGIGMAFPGPFDYEKGISKIRGLDKYDAIYNLRIEDEICSIYPKLKNCPFRFLHDVEGFALGICNGLSLSSEVKLMHLCIGTGAGSAFTRGKKVLKQAEYGMPQNGWIYDAPFKDGRIDDYISVRGLEALAVQHCKKSMDGAELFLLAESNNEAAKEAFLEFGKNIEDAIREYLIKFQPDGLIFAGQISKSFSYFGKALEEYCRKLNIKIYLEVNTSKKIIEGLYTAF
ncbi:ROK family protein [Lachnoclostridium sp.]|uniref:ROK family protein n=1 Tax=Lachnoclostridium sp. TaxID=2028282 RepID=UPI0028A0DAA5|nr:ROK family protein [Lachnoclostridium sp.]